LHKYSRTNELSDIDLKRNRHSPRCRRIIVACCVGVALIAAVTILQNRSSKTVSDLLLRYSKQPDYDAYHELACLIGSCAVSKEDGRQILQELFRPVLRFRGVYPLSRPVAIEVKFRYPVQLANMRCTKLEVVIELAGHSCIYGVQNEVYRDRVYLLEPRKEIGRQEGRVTVHVEFQQVSKECWRWPSLSSIPGSLLPERTRIAIKTPNGKTYSGTSVVPFSVDMVDPLKAPEIRRISGPTVDRAMRTSVYFGNCCGDAISVVFAAPPENAGFRILFFQESGEAYSYQPPVYIVNRRGESRTERIWLRPFVKGPGMYSGRLVLQGDSDAAYQDVRMDSVWGGKIETPITFVVED